MKKLVLSLAVLFSLGMVACGDGQKAADTAAAVDAAADAAVDSAVDSAVDTQLDSANTVETPAENAPVENADTTANK